MPLIEANGVRLFYDLTGPEGAPVVVFSNSIGTTAEMWDAQVRAFSERYRCLRYDTRGHGRSEVSEGEATIDDLATDLAGLLDGLGIEQAVIVGLSLGGMTAQAFAVRFPERLTGLVLVATSAYLPVGWAERMQAVREGGMSAIVDAVMDRWFTPAFASTSPEKVEFFRARFLAIDPKGYAACCAAIRDMDLRLPISAIVAPTLVVSGSDDPATPRPMLEDIHERILESRLVVIEPAAHIVAVEQPAMLNEQLALFLAEVAPAESVRVGGVAFESGLANRKAVLGVDHVQRSLEKAGPFAGPWQDFITRTAWGEVWGDPTIPWKTRSMVTLAMMVALHREEEFKLHVRPALKNGVTLAELRSLLIQTAIYGGVPAANGAFRWVKDVLGDAADEVDR